MLRILKSNEHIPDNKYLEDCRKQRFYKIFLLTLVCLKIYLHEFVIINFKGLIVCW